MKNGFAAVAVLAVWASGAVAQDFQAPALGDMEAAMGVQSRDPAGLWGRGYELPPRETGDLWGGPAASPTPAMQALAPGLCESYPLVDACGNSGWLAGAGVYVLWPRWNNNPAYAVGTTVFSGTTTTVTKIQHDFDQAVDFAPVVSLAYLGQGGWGVRGRAWHLEGGASASAVNPAETGPDVGTIIYSAWPMGNGFVSASSPDFNDTMLFNSRLLMDVADLEAIWVRPGPWTLTLGAGVRYAGVDQEYNASRLSVPVDPAGNSTTDRLFSAHRLQGVGPLLSLEARYPVAQTQLSLFAAARGALLFGSARESSALTTTVLDSNGTELERTLVTSSLRHNSLLPVGEIEMGVAWDAAFQRCRLRVEAAVVGQGWASAGNAANNEIIVGTAFPDEALNNQATLGLLGARLSAGLLY